MAPLRKKLLSEKIAAFFRVKPVALPICRSVATACYGKDYEHVDGDTSWLSNTDLGTSLKAVRCWGIEAAVLAAEGAETTFADQLVQIL